MKYLWLTKINRIAGTRFIYHDTLMIIPNSPTAMEILKNLAQATHYHGFSDGRWAHNPLIWDNQSAYDADDTSHSKALYQIRLIYTSDDKGLDEIPEYLGITSLEAFEE